MKQLIFFTGIILIGCVIISAVIIPTNAQQGNLEQVIEAIDSNDDSIYLLKSNNGTLCVFLKQTGEMIMNTDTSVSVLPKEDQRLLEQGIEIKNEEELYQALEDYCS